MDLADVHSGLQPI